MCIHVKRFSALALKSVLNLEIAFDVSFIDIFACKTSEFILPVMWPSNSLDLKSES